MDYLYFRLTSIDQLLRLCFGSLDEPYVWVKTFDNQGLKNRTHSDQDV